MTDIEGSGTPGRITMRHKQAPDYIIAPASGIIVHGPDPSNIFILQAFVDIPQADEEYFRPGENGHLIGDGITFKPVRMEVGAFYMTEPGLRNLYDALHRHFAPKAPTE